MKFDSIHNYYETLVVNRIMETLVDDYSQFDEDFLQDVACVALNQLPARYVRHDVDMAFFLSSDERIEMTKSVNEAVKTAAQHVSEHRDNDVRPNTYSQ